MRTRGDLAEETLRDLIYYERFVLLPVAVSLASADIYDKIMCKMGSNYAFVIS